MLISKKNNYSSGYTLIELSIVLVIIGLIVGGVLTGQHLIRAAEVRATISQVEKFKTAVNTFYGKYQAIPGDLNESTAATFGFATRGGVGQGDGDGLLTDSGNGTNQGGETGMFWNDLSYANGMNIGLIEGSYTLSTPTSDITASNVTIPQYFPAAKIGAGNFFYVYSNGGYNYYGLSSISSVNSGTLTSTGNITTYNAYTIDQKIDDGFPTTGNVTASFDSGGVVWSPAFSDAGTGPQFASLVDTLRKWVISDAEATATTTGGTTATTSGSGGTTFNTLTSLPYMCFDVTSNIYILSNAMNGNGQANYGDCGLSFRF